MMMFFQGMNGFGDSQSALNPFIEKMEKNELTLEDILNEDIIIQDIKNNNESRFINFFTNDNIKKLIDFSTKLPLSNEHNIGYKFPFNATEILCSENINFQNKLMSKKKINNNKIMNNIQKGGFLSTLFKAINKAKKEKENENDNEYESDEDDDYEIDDDDDENIDEDINDDDKDKKIIYENIDYLLRFLKERNETKENYVLVGYFYKIITHLINFHSFKIVEYLFDYPKKEEFDILELLIKNMNRKSICDIIKKLLLFEDDFKTNLLLEEKKMNLLEKIFNELNVSNEKDKYECICESLCLIFNNKSFFDIFMKKPNLLEILYNILINSKNNTKKLNSILKLLTKINDNILLHFENRITLNSKDNNDMMPFNYDPYFYNNNLSGPEDNITDIFKNFLLNYFNILEKNEFIFLDDLGNCSQDENSVFISTYLESQKKIGIKKIIQTEYILSILDIFVNSYATAYHQDIIEKLINIANNQNIFWNLHNLFFLFPFSNIYQIYYNQIMDIILNENSPNCLIENAFIEKIENKNLVNIYIDKVLNNLKFIFKLTNTSSLNPSFSYIITLLNKIFNNQNLYLQTIIDKNKDLTAFYEIIGKEVSEIFEQKLLLNNNQGLNFGDIEDDNLSSFGPKNFLELLEEDYKIYESYKKGENYEIMLKEKKERIENEKKEKENEMKNNKKERIEYIDDLDDEDPLFKVEKININKEKENFLSLLNKPTEEIKKMEENINEDILDLNEDINIDNIDIDDENKDKENCRFDIKELEDDYEEQNNIIIDDNEKEKINNENEINEDISPSPFENKVYHIEYNRNKTDIEEEKNEDHNKMIKSKE